MNKYNICTVDNYNVNNLTISKPYNVNDNTYIFNIKYMKNVCLIQTPISIIPYSYSLYDNNSFKIDIVTDTATLHKMLDDISSFITSKINKYNKRYLHNKNIKSISSNIDDTRYKLSLLNKDANNIYTFNSKQEPISLTTLHTFDKIICLFELKRLVLKNDKGFWQTNLLQIKKCSSIIQPSFAQCLIVSSNDTSVKDNDSNRYASYLKMFQMKIPLEAIRHKMLIDGLTENDFSIWSKTVNNQIPRPPPLPPPPPPPFSQLNKKILDNPNKSGGPEFLKDISSGNFQLRKTDTIKQKVLATVPKEYAPPSLNDIRSALSKLKKVNV